MSRSFGIGAVREPGLSLRLGSKRRERLKRPPRPDHQVKGRGGRVWSGPLVEMATVDGFTAAVWEFINPQRQPG